MTLLTIFSRLEDPRHGPAKRYDLSEAVIMAICAVPTIGWLWRIGAKTNEETWLKTFLTLPNGTPSHDNFGNFFHVLDTAVVESCFREWIGGRVDVVRDIVALDGKTARGSKDGTNSPLHLVSAYVTSLKLTLSQEGSVGKGNELKAIRALLDVPVLDALGCQTNVSAAIVDLGWDYVLSVKDNQKGLEETADDFFVTGEKFCWHGVDIQKRRQSRKIMADTKPDGRCW